MLQPFIDRIVPRAYRHGTSSLARHDRTLFFVWCLSGEVNNGGFAQFFSNSLGDRAWPTEGALRRIGANAFAKLLARAITVSFAGGRFPRDQERRSALLSELPARQAHELAQLDERFYALDKGDGLFDQLARYYFPALARAYFKIAPPPSATTAKRNRKAPQPSKSSNQRLQPTGFAGG